MLTCLALLCSQNAQPTALERIDAYLPPEMATWHVPGVSVAVVKDGETVAAKGWGTADLELGAPADADTVYELLSVSKQFTAAAVLLLVESGRVALTDGIAKYVDGCPESWKVVTVAQCLSHTSGIPDYTDQPGWAASLRSERAPRELALSVASRPMLFAPGSSWKYSNTNYYLLGLLIERASGESYESFVGAHLLSPLGMKATRMESFDELIPHRARGYRFDGARLFNAPWIDPSHKWAAGAFVSNVRDLATWVTALDSDRLLQRASRDRMLEPAKLADGSSANYGFGTELELDHGHRVSGHQGGGMAFNACVRRYVDEHLAVIVLCNQTQAPSSAWARHIASFWIADLADSEAGATDTDPEFSSSFRGLLLGAAKGQVDGEKFASDVRDKMKVFVEHAGPKFLAPLGTLDTLTLLSSKAGSGGTTLRYRAKYSGGALLWTVEVDRERKIRSMEPELQ